LFFAADKTDPGAYNLPLYLAFADPMHCPGGRFQRRERFFLPTVSRTTSRAPCAAVTTVRSCP
jgi:hypothetical protein